MKRALLIIAALALVGCGGTRDESQRRSWATVWHAADALERGGSRQHIAAGLKAIADRNAEAQGFKFNKSPTATEASSHE